MQYRREIDGLRALAVMPVIFFHAGFEGFKGGFVGVDIFFVISGYLITSIIVGEIEQGQFSIRRFYERRARRILPALFAVMAASCLFAWYMVPPKQFLEFGHSLIAVSLFASNVLFWSEAGYFAPAAEEKPLLHTWSLAVEEQFYIFFPLLLLLLWRLGDRRVRYLVAFMALVSLVASEWGSRHMPGANFYLAPSRAWELLLGSLAALAIGRGEWQVAYGPRQVLSAAGLVMILLSIFLIDESTPFPGMYALLPTVGTLLIILFAGSSTAVGRVLSTRALVGIGLISYSAYLWHQPVLAFLRLYLTNPITDLTRFAVVAGTLALAVASWHFVEKPFRDRKRVSARGIAIFSLAGIAVFSLAGIAISRADGAPSRFHFEQLEEGSLVRPARERECFDFSRIHEREGWNCVIGDRSAGKTPDFLVFGDSHALSLLQLFDSSASSLGQIGLFAGTAGCIPFLGVYPITRADQTDKDCHALNLRVAELIKTQGIRKIVLVARWSYYTDGDYESFKINFLSTRRDGLVSQEESRRAFVVGLSETLRHYGDLGVEVGVVLQVPMQLHKPDKVFAKVGRADSAEDKQMVLDALSVPRSEHDRLMAFVEEAVRPYRGNSKVTIVDPASILCDQQRCSIGSIGSSYYFDDDHLSVVGAARLRALAEVLLQPSKPL